MMNDSKYGASKSTSTEESEIDRDNDHSNNVIWCKIMDSYTGIEVG